MKKPAYLSKPLEKSHTKIGLLLFLYDALNWWDQIADANILIVLCKNKC